MATSRRALALGFLCVAHACAHRSKNRDDRPDEAGTAEDPPASDAPESSLWSAWPMGAHDPQRRGRSPYVGPQAPAERGALDVPEPGALVIGPDKTLYVASFDEWIYALDPSGERLWSYLREDAPTGGVARYLPSIAVGPDGTLYVASHNGPLYALAPDGSLAWSFTTGKTTLTGSDSSFFSAPVPSADGRLYVGEGSLLYVFEKDGSLAWLYDLRTNTSIGSTVLTEDGTIYTKAYYGALHALSPTGTLLWTYDPVEARDIPSLGADGTLYLAGPYRFDAVGPDGALRWQKSGSFGAVPPVSSDGTLYLSNSVGVLATNPDGGARWRFAAGGAYSFVDAAGTSYSCDEQGLYAVDPSGALQWWHAVAGGAIPLALSDDGTLYALYEGAIHRLGGGGACEGSPPSCDDEDPCTSDTCENVAGCIHTPKCVSDGCRTASCDADGACSFAPVADGTVCGGELSCAPSQVCRSGECRPVGDGCALAARGWPSAAHDARRARAGEALGPATPVLRFDPAIADVTSFVVAADGTAYVAGASGIRRIDGSGAASSITDLTATALTLRNDGVLYVTSDASVSAIRDGSTLWTFSAATELGAPAIGPAGALHFAADDFAFRAIDPDGSPRFRRPTGTRDTAPAAIASDGTTYFLSPDLEALAPDGTVLWRRHLGTIVQPPVLGQDGTVYVSADEVLYALDSDGTERWSLPVAATSLAVSPSGALIAAGRTELSALNEDGGLEWSFAPPGADVLELSLNAPVVDGDGAVYVATNAYSRDLFVPPVTATLYALEPDGTLRWSLTFDLEPYEALDALALGGDGALFFLLADALQAIGP